MSSRSIARCGLCCALLACSAWISLPFGFVPFTLQTLVVALLPQIMPTREALVTVGIYLVMGAVGLPVFSSFQGGIGVLAGPTGGYLWGFAVGMVPAGIIARVKTLPSRLRGPLSGAATVIVSYVLGTIQLMIVAELPAHLALAAAVVPFIIPDIVKILASSAIARAINRALGGSVKRI